MINLGDITKISGYNAPIVDVVIGGSPCQDLSVAGKRAGLAGERSGLYMEQIRIIKEMREHDKTGGRTGQFVRPRYMVWENVPGAFSSNHGKDFAAVLEEAVGIVEPEVPNVPVPEKGWPTSGCLMGDGWSVAWRVLDAQFWGVPQRRRRIALVADFGGHTAPEILFVRESVSGDSETGRETWEGFAGDAENGVRAAVDGLDHVMLSGGTTYQGRGWYYDVSGCLKTQAHGVCCINDQGGSVMGVSENAAGTLRAQEHGRQPIVYNEETITSKANASNPHEGDPCHTLGATGAGRTICIQGNCIDRADTARCNGKGWRDDDISFTLNTIDRPAVYDARGNGDGNTVPTLTGDHQNRVTDYTAVCIPVNTMIATRHNALGERTGLCIGTDNPEIAGTLDASYYKGTGARNGNERTVVCAVDCRNGVENPDINGTLQSKPNGGMSLNLQNVVRECSSVRRLTPLECERLQGFPCGWTDIGEWVDSKGKKRQTTDSARYKALGNSIALPPWKWVLKRLCAQYERDATMASLFDGIGGFPLIWEQFNGRGSCLWASEIDEFPIAVTRKRFREDKYNG